VICALHNFCWQRFRGYLPWQPQVLQWCVNEPYKPATQTALNNLCYTWIIQTSIKICIPCQRTTRAQNFQFPRFDQLGLLRAEAHKLMYNIDMASSLFSCKFHWKKPHSGNMREPIAIPDPSSLLQQAPGRFQRRYPPTDSMEHISKHKIQELECSHEDTQIHATKWKLKSVPSDSDCKADASDRLLYREQIQNKVGYQWAAERDMAITGTPSSSFIKAKAIEVGKEGILSCTKQYQTLVTGQGHTISPSMNFKDW